MTEYVHVGRHADVLHSGLGIGPGDRVKTADLDKTGDQHLIDEEILVDVKSFETGASNVPLPTGQELQARAAELNIEGRSKMTADQLREAIALAESKGN